MSEVKGQILGIVLVLALFGIVAGLMKSSFGTYKTKIEAQTTEIANSISTTD